MNTEIEKLSEKMEAIAKRLDDSQSHQNTVVTAAAAIAAGLFGALTIAGTWTMVSERESLANLQIRLEDSIEKQRLELKGDIKHQVGLASILPEVSVFTLVGAPFKGSEIEASHLLTFDDSPQELGIPIYYTLKNDGGGSANKLFIRIFWNAPLTSKSRHSSAFNGFDYSRWVTLDSGLPGGGFTTNGYTTLRLDRSHYPIPVGSYPMRLEVFSESTLLTSADFSLRIPESLPVRRWTKEIFLPEDFLQEGVADRIEPQKN